MNAINWFDLAQDVTAPLVGSDEQRDLAAHDVTELEAVQRSIHWEHTFRESVRGFCWCVIDAEGWHHVEGRYFANINDAERVRIAFAERMVRDMDRLDAWRARHSKGTAHAESC